LSVARNFWHADNWLTCSISTSCYFLISMRLATVVCVCCYKTKCCSWHVSNHLLPPPSSFLREWNRNPPKKGNKERKRGSGLSTAIRRCWVVGGSHLSSQFLSLCSSNIAPSLSLFWSVCVCVFVTHTTHCWTCQGNASENCT
jgi:hypothetical protein